MPAVTAPAKILVTGATGYVATWYIKFLLNKGYTVVGTVRSDAKGDFLVDLYSKEHPGKFTYAIVTDIVKVGAFDDVVKLGFDGVAHAASPVTMESMDAASVVEPAITGTVSILESIKKYGPTIKRVVLTSSVAAMSEPKSGAYTYTKADWNEAAAKNYRDHKTGGVAAYVASKALAERAAWEYIDKNKAEIKFDMVSINPPFMFGPFISQVTSLSSLSSSAMIANRSRSDQTPEQRSAYNGAWGDVRDVAEVHAELFSTEGIAGERIVPSPGGYSTQDILDALNVEPAFPKTPLGIPKPETERIYPQNFDNTLAKKLLGKEFITLEKSVRETAQQYVDNGFW